MITLQADAKKLQTMAGTNEEGNMPADMVALIGNLWVDAGVQACFERANMYDINDPSS